jgi:hypothetical protein
MSKRAAPVFSSIGSKMYTVDTLGDALHNLAGSKIVNKRGNRVDPRAAAKEEKPLTPFL